VAKAPDSDDQGSDAESEPADVDPEDFIRAVLKISPEDAKKAREDAAKAMKRNDNEPDGS
jgi:hypothetical protein